MDTRSPAASGLVDYIRSVADALGDDVAEVDVDFDDGLATAIILVRSHVPTLLELPLLLTWDEVSGWALRVETDGTGDTTALQFLGGDILPGAEVVRDFLGEAVRGGSPGLMLPPAFRMPNAGDELEHRLAQFRA